MLFLDFPGIRIDRKWTLGGTHVGPSNSGSVTALTSGFHETAIFDQGVLPPLR